VDIRTRVRTKRLQKRQISRKRVNEKKGLEESKFLRQGRSPLREISIINRHPRKKDHLQKSRKQGKLESGENLVSKKENPFFGELIEKGLKVAVRDRNLEVRTFRSEKRVKISGPETEDRKGWGRKAGKILWVGQKTKGVSRPQ